MERFCGQGQPSTVTIAGAGDSAFTVERGEGESVLSVRHDGIGNRTLAKTFDPDAYLEFTGISQLSDTSRARAIEAAIQPVQLYRPSAQILVMTGPANDSIFGRCPDT